MNQELQPKVKLNNGIKMPQLGLGVWKSSISDAAKSVKMALDNGYVLIDTAKQYGNEAGVGAGIQAAIKSGKITRQDVFLTTKIFNGDQQGDYDHIRSAFNEQLKHLQTDHVDLLLEHWPVDDRYTETWKALEAIQQDGQARAIGVCNFDEPHMKELLASANVKPAVNQIEFNPLIQQPQTVRFCQSQGIKLEAWSPLGNGKLLKNPLINDIAKIHHKSAAQVELRWGIQHGFIVISKTVHEERLKENADIFDFTLDPEEMEKIDGLDEEKHTLWYDDYQWHGNPNGFPDYIMNAGQ